MVGYFFFLNWKKKKLLLFGGDPRNEYDEAQNSIIKISYFSFSKKKFFLFVFYIDLWVWGLEEKGHGWLI